MGANEVPSLNLTKYKSGSAKERRDLLLVERIGRHSDDGLMSPIRLGKREGISYWMSDAPRNAEGGHGRSLADRRLMSPKWSREVLSLILANYLSDAPRNAEGGHGRSLARWRILCLKWRREVLSLISAKYLSDAPRNAEGGHGRSYARLGLMSPSIRGRSALFRQSI